MSESASPSPRAKDKHKAVTAVTRRSSNSARIPPKTARRIPVRAPTAAC